MTIFQALKKAKENGLKVRPVSWREMNPQNWIESGTDLYGETRFYEDGPEEEIPHSPLLCTEEELLGPWEVFPGQQG